ncbi:MAG: hypothetical protein ACK559_23280, partial [bacterium]
MRGSQPPTGRVRRWASLRATGDSVGVPKPSSVGQMPGGDDVPAPVNADVPPATGQLGSRFAPENRSEGSRSAG